MSVNGSRPQQRGEVPLGSRGDEYPRKLAFFSLPVDASALQTCKATTLNSFTQQEKWLSMSLKSWLSMRLPSSTLFAPLDQLSYSFSTGMWNCFRLLTLLNYSGPEKAGAQRAEVRSGNYAGIIGNLASLMVV